jgi:hypothetical protein
MCSNRESVVILGKAIKKLNLPHDEIVCEFVDAHRSSCVSGLCRWSHRKLFLTKINCDKMFGTVSLAESLLKVAEDIINGICP